MKPIKRLLKGSPPTPLEVAYFNQIVDLLNALIMAQVTPAGFGNVKIGDRNVVFDFSPGQSALNTRLQAIEKSVANSQTQVTQLVNAMRGASITAICNGDGSISITINFPGV